ncbi:hypothetical protein GCM10007315_05700 [Gemmobacter tilapiae]|uniref:DUF3422 domain-containing protein n=2 Tax=Neogemmobacter tilapiae TaxID=875041 RepID=A0A918WFM2_9RHOB|nr:hypothetical protein GCM10007315_05700 [Gemmobacter tilapiae]
MDHPLRHALVDELHARPFPVLQAPAHVVFMALKEPGNSVNRDRGADLALLNDWLAAQGMAAALPGAMHHTGQGGRASLKWESHTEFVTYAAFQPGLPDQAFDPMEGEVFPKDWLAGSAAQRLVAGLIRVEEMPEDEAAMLARLEGWLQAESLAVARVVDGAAVIAGDFRIDEGGYMRFAVFVRPGTGPRRVGRIVQRLCEIETYRAMSMLGLARVRDLTRVLNDLDPRLSALVGRLDESGGAESALHDLLQISAELERLSVQHGFRFGATAAYQAIVAQRITVLREERVAGRQSFGEFMMRRYDPAMRTVKSAEVRLNAMAERAARAAELLRTRVDVERQAQNQKLLASMDHRADLQLRLQHTVEGLSVVAISYYALGLLGYLAKPLAHWAHLDQTWVMAGLVPVTLGLVWWGLRWIKSGHTQNLP